MENQENGTGVALSNTEASTNEITLKADYGNGIAHGVSGNVEAVMLGFQEAKPMPFNANKESWLPTELGDRRLLMFSGAEMNTIIDEQTQTPKTLPYVLFFEMYENKVTKKQELRTIMIARTQIVNFFLVYDRATNTILGAKHKPNTFWFITYTGLKAIKGKNVHTYTINPAQFGK